MAFREWRVLGDATAEFGGSLGAALGGGGCVPVDQIDGAIAENATFTHPADGVVAYTLASIPASTESTLSFRMQDIENRWFSYITSGNFRLYERVAGVNTLRASAAPTIAANDRIAVVLDGTTITGYINSVQRWTYASASNFATETDGQDTGREETNSDLKTWSLACRAEEGV